MTINLKEIFTLFKPANAYAKQKLKHWNMHLDSIV